MTAHPAGRGRAEAERPMYYIVEHKWDGYCQRFSKLNRWNDVLQWARDGSLKQGEEVLAVCRAKRQPKIGRQP
jgi:hypothetical protein